MIKFYDEKQLNNKTTEELIDLHKELRFVITGRKFACDTPSSSDITINKKYETMLVTLDSIITKRQNLESASRPRKTGHDKRARRHGIEMKRGYDA
ncbi:MAG: hypothetical protein ACRCWQ_02075 [Bacilli bacterium]